MAAMLGTLWREVNAQGGRYYGDGKSDPPLAATPAWTEPMRRWAQMALNVDHKLPETHLEKQLGILLYGDPVGYRQADGIVIFVGKIFGREGKCTFT